MIIELTKEDELPYCGKFFLYYSATRDGWILTKATMDDDQGTVRFSNRGERVFTTAAEAVDNLIWGTYP